MTEKVVKHGLFYLKNNKRGYFVFRIAIGDDENVIIKELSEMITEVLKKRKVKWIYIKA